jgi:hypothetical protein
MLRGIWRRDFAGAPETRDFVSSTGRLEPNRDLRLDFNGGPLEQALLRTLAHEMTHAFLSYYACQRRACIYMKPSSQSGTGKVGTGHNGQIL